MGVSMGKRLGRLMGDLGRDEGAISTIVFALSLATLMGTSALAIDMGSLFLAQRRLQGVADAAVMAGVGGGVATDTTSATNSIKAMIAASGVSGVTITKVQPGSYVQDSSVAIDQRFTPDGAGGGALRLTLQQQVPLFFGRLITGTDNTGVTAVATAARADAAAYSLGSHLLSTSNGLVGSVLTAIAGQNLGVSNSQLLQLSGTSVPIAQFADALRQRLGKGSATFDSVFDSKQSLSDVLSAAASVSASTTSAQTLSSIAANVTGQVRVGDVIDLGSFGQGDIIDGRVTAQVDTYTLVRSILQSSDSSSQKIALNITVPGVATVAATVVGGPGTVHSPLLTLKSASTVTLRTAQTRIALNAVTSVIGMPGLTVLNVPVFVEIAPATAQLTAVSCTGTSGLDAARLGVVPSVGKAAIAQFDATKLSDMSTAMSLTTATLANVTLARVTAYSNITLGGASQQTVSFSRSDVNAKVIKSVATNDVVTALAASLVSQANVQVTVLLLNANATAVTQTVGNTLKTVAPSLDTIINSLSEALGVRLGMADVGIDQLRCGMPVLV